MESETPLTDRTQSRPLSASSTQSTHSAPGSEPGVAVRFVRSTFRHRKTSLTLLTLLSFILAMLFSFMDSSLDWSVPIDPRNEIEAASLQSAWADLLVIGLRRHPYNSHANDALHDYIEEQVRSIVSNLTFMEYDNDLNYTNKFLAKATRTDDGAAYYESNNILARVNGTHPELPALLLSAHFDSVPLSTGVTDDGIGIATMLGALRKIAMEGAQPRRTIIFNFNNNEEFGLDGALAFLYHPWSKLVGYFLNLEGTGAGGKAILFRGTDYGIVKHFGAVRYPYGHSMFQEAMSHSVVHSDTDYRVYKERGHFRGLDMAFYKPRSFYHTTGDNLKRISRKSLWHMLSNTLDFIESVLLQEIDIDTASGSDTKLNEIASFVSFLNVFFCAPSSTMATISFAMLIGIPLVSLILLLIIWRCRKNWNVGFFNFIKFPIALYCAYLVVSSLAENVVSSVNPLLANSYFEAIMALYVSASLLTLYVMLNIMNVVFKACKSSHHDQKLIVSLQVSFLYWILAWAWTVGISKSGSNYDRSGEFPILLLYVLLTPGCLIGLFGWCLKKRCPSRAATSDELQPLLLSENDDRTDAQAQSYAAHHDTALSSSTTSKFSHQSAPDLDQRRSHGYDWLLQFLAVVPLSLIVVYHMGYLGIDAMANTVQEASVIRHMESRNLQVFALFLSLPLAPFVFKFNRFLVFVLVTVLSLSMVSISLLPAFNNSNPLKLRFVQTIDLDSLPQDSYVHVMGVRGHPFAGYLRDLPSVRSSNEPVICANMTGGFQKCSYKSSLQPHLAPQVHSSDDLIKITVLKNTTSNLDFPFGLVSGEFMIQAPENRMCLLRFNVSDETSRINQLSSDAPVVKAITVYDHSPNHWTETNFNYAPGNKGHHNETVTKYTLRQSSGFTTLDLNRLGFNGVYHIGLEWTPSVVNGHEVDAEKLKLRNLGVAVECQWSDLAPFAQGSDVFDRVPAFNEVHALTPSNVSLSNYGRGVVAVSRYFEL